MEDGGWRMEDLMTDDDTIRRVLELPGTWAVVGWSPRPERPSHEVTAFLSRPGTPWCG